MVNVKRILLLHAHNARKLHFPNDLSRTMGNTTAYQYWFKPSTSETVELTVQKDPIKSIENNPLPTGYWTRPVYGENKGWSSIADNWLMRRYNFPSRFFSGDTAFAPYTSAPNSAHVLWTKTIIFGGIAGGHSATKPTTQGYHTSNSITH